MRGVCEVELRVACASDIDMYLSTLMHVNFHAIAFANSAAFLDVGNKIKSINKCACE